MFAKSKNSQKQSTSAAFLEFIFLLILVFLIRTFGFGLYQVPSGSMETTMLVGERFFADKLSYWVRNPKRGEIIAFNQPVYKYSNNFVVSLFEQYVWGPQNWTKRIIGIPGDTIEGRVEDGKAVVYLNGNKLDEPYLNQYPLLPVLKVDPKELQKQIDRELGVFLRSKSVDQASIDQLIWNKIAQQATTVSYDPSASYENQPFYRIQPDRIVRNESGGIDLLVPGTAHTIRQGNALVGRKRYWDKSDIFYVELGEDEYWCMGDNRQGSQDCRFFGPIKGSTIHGRILFRLWSHDSFESWWIVDLIKNPIDFWSRMRWSRFFQWVY